MEKELNYKDLATIARETLEKLHNNEVKGVDEKEKINLIGKLTNIYKAKLEHEINKHKFDTHIPFFED